MENTNTVKAITWLEWLEQDESWLEDHPTSTLAERVEAMENYIHNLQHAGVNPEIFIIDQLGGGQYVVGFAKHVPEYWDAIGARAAQSANEQRLRQVLESVGIDPSSVVIAGIPLQG